MAGGSYELTFHKKALAGLAAIEPKRVRDTVKQRAKSLADNPFPPDCVQLNGIKKNGKTVHRIRSGDFRVIYVVSNDPKQVSVLDIRNRRDGYDRI